jgi:ribonucleoside-diphosphate reductase beta chain
MTQALRPDISTATRAFQTDTVPWRLYSRGKELAWDPATIDFSQDARDWAEMDDALRHLVARLATSFMVGEEAVTLDILPLLRAISEEGRLEESMFLTTFVGDEAKHTEVFRRWFDAVGFEEPLAELLPPAYRQIFYEEQPRVMRRLDTDRSPQAVLDAALTYNHFVEGVVAMTGYFAWERIFMVRDILPGIREGIGYIQRDERRHIAYGTYLCRRIIAAEPELWGFVEERMSFLRELGVRFVEEMAQALLTDLGFQLPTNGSLLERAEREAQNPGDDPTALALLILKEFADYGTTRLGRRLEAIEVARRTSLREVAESTLEEDLEAELEAG